MDEGCRRRTRSEIEDSSEGDKRVKQMLRSRNGIKRRRPENKMRSSYNRNIVHCSQGHSPLVPVIATAAKHSCSLSILQRQEIQEIQFR